MKTSIIQTYQEHINLIGINYKVYTINIHISVFILNIPSHINNK